MAQFPFDESVDPSDRQDEAPDITSEEAANNAYIEMLEDTREAAKYDSAMRKLRESLIDDLSEY